jgi:hypothetical protein
LIHWLAREGQMSICLRRREFIAGLGYAAAWPLAEQAQCRATVLSMADEVIEWAGWTA